MTTPKMYALIRPARLDLDSFARASGLHPGLVARYVALGLLEVEYDSRGQLIFAPDQIAAAARLQRLRLGLSLNYAALGVVVDLLDRIATLEAALQTGSRRTGGSP
jgi:hypothetical protein